MQLLIIYDLKNAYGLESSAFLIWIIAYADGTLLRECLQDPELSQYSVGRSYWVRKNYQTHAYKSYVNLFGFVSFTSSCLGTQVIMLDEAHERGLSTDILFGVIREFQEKRCPILSFHD